MGDDEEIKLLPTPTATGGRRSSPGFRPTLEQAVRELVEEMVPVDR